ncbi:hypothetical protein [Sphingomonas sp.]|uniref:hypothetical protein n=1 Tax=Sphingomonas sp. TaxID=28214 RepID=UPI0025FC962A|nr:hypothetical protein [Sphingomonas sp.]
MSYVAKTAGFGASILRGLAILLAFIACLYVALLAYLWFISRPNHYVMYSSEPLSEADRQNQKAALDLFQRHGACEHFGKAGEWKGRPSLAFTVSPEFEQDDIGCIRARAPRGFQLEKQGWLS